MASRERNKLLPAAGEERIGGDNERIGADSDGIAECSFELVFRARLNGK